MSNASQVLSEKDRLIAALQDSLKECYYRNNELLEHIKELEAQLASTIFDYEIQIAGSSDDISVLVHNDRGSVQVKTIGADGRTIQTRTMSN